MECRYCGGFSLEKTLESGQVFMWWIDAGWYYLLQREEIWKIKQVGHWLYCAQGDMNRLMEFLGVDGIDRHWQDIEEELPDAVMDVSSGISLLRQDLWQALVTFICSSAAPMSKIRTNLWSIAEHFGTPGEIDGMSYATFPGPGSLDDRDALLKAKTGYRADYLLALNALVREDPGFLDRVVTNSYPQSKELLMRVPGVGEKVADCVCLFALGQETAFPVDTWIQRYVERFLLEEQPSRRPSPKQCAELLAMKYQSHPGLAQQFIFYYMTKTFSTRKAP